MDQLKAVLSLQTSCRLSTWRLTCLDRQAEGCPVLIYQLRAVFVADSRAFDTPFSSSLSSLNSCMDSLNSSIATPFTLSLATYSILPKEPNALTGSSRYCFIFKNNCSPMDYIDVYPMTTVIFIFYFHSMESYINTHPSFPTHTQPRHKLIFTNIY